MFCTSNDPYANYDGAFACMAKGDGEVAFIRHDTVFEMTNATTTLKPDVIIICFAQKMLKSSR